ncbi:MAG: hypothetical protein NW207_01930 [Cytophagales bacterium]|nr:hypothetical protein [Cytophagales bacterium]
MELKISKAEAEQYSKALSSKILDIQYVEKQYISGKDILQITPIHQVNYFILRILFQKWNEDVQKIISSPYFDYSHPDVLKSFNQFTNLVSNHIKVQKSDFESILTQAIEESIYFILNPYQYFKKYIFTPEKQRITLQELVLLKKYIKHNSIFYDYFLEKIQAIKIDTFLTSDLFTLFQQIYFSKTDLLESPERVIAKFDELLKFDLITNDENEQPAKKITQASPTLPNTTSPAQIKLTLNQRIMFQKYLFANDEEQLNHALARIETTATYEAAMQIIKYYNWDMDNEITQEFCQLIESKIHRSDSN